MDIRLSSGWPAVMFITAVCLIFLLKLKWPKNKSVYRMWDHPVYFWDVTNHRAQKPRWPSWLCRLGSVGFPHTISLMFWPKNPFCTCTGQISTLYFWSVIIWVLLGPLNNAQWIDWILMLIIILFNPHLKRLVIKGDKWLFWLFLFLAPN